MAKKKEKAENNPIPEDYQEMIGELAQDPGYIAAWTHAESHGNPPKACYVYADSHWQDYDKSKEPTDEQLREQLAVLQNKIEERQRAEST